MQGSLMFPAAALAAGLVFCLAGCGRTGPPGASSAGPEPAFSPINHASFVMTVPGLVVYVDPVGDLDSYKGLPAPDVILVTHTHGDHLAPALIGAVRREGTEIIGPQAVIDQLKDGRALKNGESCEVRGLTVEAVPAYNTTEERLKFHPKGVGNGYVVTAGGKRIYISGDTEDVPEMRALRNIDYAFLCMNLPYTMTVDQAAAAALEIKPKVVMPYHYRAGGGAEKSDIEKFKRLVSANPGIEVRLLKWY